ncbi:MAG: peptidase M16 [Alphaproteobacteria bacterium]|nr:peptidase M16 [Alphaproteobacteria bacterium]
MSVQISKTSNGLTVITDEMPHIETAAMGLWIGCGTRHENMHQNGIAHMVEHMLFKGTKKRTAEQISVESEDRGADLNAYTSRERTAYYMHLLKDDVTFGTDMISDMVQNSIFPDAEIKKEREVIGQEIGMYMDTPDEHVFDLMQEVAYPNQSFGAPILGTKEVLGMLERQDMESYVRRQYGTDKMAFIASGNVDHCKLVEDIEHSFSKLPQQSTLVNEAPEYSGGHHYEVRDLEQAHLVLCFEGISFTDDDYFAARLLAVLLGGGMSSRLFLEIRENRGLVYSVYAFNQGYSDTGLFGVYAGTGEGSLTELLPVLCEELHKTKITITEEELRRAKMQIRAGILMSRESPYKRANMIARHYLQYQKPLDIFAQIEKLEKVTVEDIKRVAARVFRQKPTVTALGPVSPLEPYDNICGRFA